MSTSGTAGVGPQVLRLASASPTSRQRPHLHAAVTEECTCPIMCLSEALASGAHAILNSSINLPDTAEVEKAGGDVGHVGNFSVGDAPPGVLSRRHPLRCCPPLVIPQPLARHLM
jgi:hypothetical protein